MKALTVQQPWAWAIIHGGKNIENRTQNWGYRGPLAIHAGMRLSQRGVESPLVEQALTDASYFDDPGAELLEARGAIIGVVDLVDVHHAEPEIQTDSGLGLWARACCSSPWAEQQYEEHGGRTRRDIVHLVLERPRPLAEPIPCRGALGLWNLPPELLRDVVEGQVLTA